MRLQIVDAEKYYRLSEKNRIRQRFMPAPRGKILDRYGIEIANTRPGFYVSVIKALIAKAVKGDVRAAQLLLERGYGKPDQRSFISGSEDGPVIVSIHGNI